MKNILRRISVQAALGLAALAAACGGTPAASTSAADTQRELGAAKPPAQATGTDEDKAGGKNPFVKALDDLRLKPEQQRAVDKLKAEAQKRHRPVRQAEAALMNAIAESVERGQIDRCSLSSQIKQLASAKAEANKGDRHALEKLHEILDADQRGKLADALAAAAAAHTAAHDSGKMVDKIADELQLNDDQKAKIRKLADAAKSVRDVERGTDVRDRWTKIVNAFKSDCFALDKIAPSCNLEQGYETMIDDMVDAAQHVVSILDRKQRNRLANLLHEKAEEFGGQPEQGGANVGQAGGAGPEQEGPEGAQQGGAFGGQGQGQGQGGIGPQLGVGSPNVFGSPNAQGFGFGQAPGVSMQPGAGGLGQPIGYGQLGPSSQMGQPGAPIGAPQATPQGGVAQEAPTGCAPAAGPGGEEEAEGESPGQPQTTQPTAPNAGETTDAEEDLGIHGIAAGVGACAKSEGK